MLRIEMTPEQREWMLNNWKDSNLKEASRVLNVGVPVIDRFRRELRLPRHPAGHPRLQNNK